ncbi:MAG: GNAT family N-acetyltransferase [Myxococcaceae bacterium]|nr:GNAT family N-acetyltransferase [Myxococcaceae bacterium]
MRIDLDGLSLRAPHADDAQALAALANDRGVWRNMRDLFPHPYTLQHANQFIARQAQPSPNRIFLIDVAGAVAGACGVHPLSDVYARGAEVSYWLGAPFAGRGIATKAVAALTRFGFEQLGLARLQAGVFEWNQASARVLEKNGYVREAVLRKSVFKDGQLIDSFLYAKVNPAL